VGFLPDLGSSKTIQQAAPRASKDSGHTCSATVGPAHAKPPSLSVPAAIVKEPRKPLRGKYFRQHGPWGGRGRRALAGRHWDDGSAGRRAPGETRWGQPSITAALALAASLQKWVFGGRIAPCCGDAPGRGRRPRREGCIPRHAAPRNSVVFRVASKTRPFRRLYDIPGTNAPQAAAILARVLRRVGPTPGREAQQMSGCGRWIETVWCGLSGYAVHISRGGWRGHRAKTQGHVCSEGNSQDLGQEIDADVREWPCLCIKE
jgi:hypothetical protein